MKQDFGQDIDDPAEDVGAVRHVAVVQHFRRQDQRKIFADATAPDLNAGSVQLVKAAVEERHSRITERATAHHAGKQELIRRALRRQRHGERTGENSGLERKRLQGGKPNYVGNPYLLNVHQVFFVLLSSSGAAETKRFRRIPIKIQNILYTKNMTIPTIFY